MTSIGVKINNSVTRQFGPYCFKIQGELTERIREECKAKR